MKARQIFWQKSRLQGRYVVELRIYEVGNPVQYPNGVKYSLVCIDLVTRRKVLMDNHHPKGPHTHLDGSEVPYVLSDVTTLLADFKRLVLEHLEVKL
ncbi:MAG: hypothetical protein HY390_07930 [Deltaproteobacteria bacterium]|nr:hypothetical protein [Deltaproteobacteria bacterium]